MSTPYLLETNDAYSYEFVTDQGIRYSVFFAHSPYLLIDFPNIHSFVYSFNIVPLNGDPDGLVEDARIQYTIFEVFKRFFSTIENVAVYVCDSSDARHAVRSRKFNIWFFRFSDGGIVKKDGRIMLSDGDTIYTSILVHRNNVELDEIIEAFDELNGRSNK